MPSTDQFHAYRQWIREELQNSTDFWLTHGIDHLHGGVYTCLDRKGDIFSTDKSVWMQGRCAYLFSYLCQVYGKRPEWLDAAKSCLDFLEAHCINRNAGGRLYFTVTKDGRPLRQRRYCFSEAFYVMGNAEYAAVTGDNEALIRARAYYDLIYKLNHGLMIDPVGLAPKTIPETRTGRALADPMIYLNLSAVMRNCDPERRSLYDERAKESAEEIVQYHLKPQIGCTLETVGLHGEIMDEFTAGRMVNPGHDMECAWFLMEEATYQHNASLHGQAKQMFDFAIQKGWDHEYGGILYFVDCKGLPPEAYEHDMKLWWPHNELLIASLMLYRDVKQPEYLHWFEKTLAYCWEVFSDPAYGEWFGYLRRDGKPTEPPCKGSTFKGPFHLLRMLVMVDQMLGQIIAAHQYRKEGSKIIYDAIQNAGLYKGISQNLDHALAYMMTTDVSGFPAGKHVVAGDKIYLMIQEPALKRFEDTAWEAHRKYIDIQFAFREGETIAFASIGSIGGWEAYTEGTDGLCSHSPAQGVHLPMPPGMFAVFFPNDAHRPLIGEGRTRKAVLKVLVEKTEQREALRQSYELPLPDAGQECGLNDSVQDLVWRIVLPRFVLIPMLDTLRQMLVASLLMRRFC